MIARRLKTKLQNLLTHFPAVALLGARQVGKTTLARLIAAEKEALYLDLESTEDMDKLSNPEVYLSSHEQHLVVIDEIQRYPNLFRSLRVLIDRGRQKGLRVGRFLLLGSAAPDLLQQSAETLAGRIAYLELNPFDLQEIDNNAAEKLWVRGGFPDSFLASNDAASFNWRENFIRTYLERDVPQLGLRIPATTLQRFWTMLAHVQGNPLNSAALSRSLGVDDKTVGRYLDLLVDLLLVRRLPPWRSNVGKRLLKAPKIYLRDSGIAHALLELRDREKILGHPTAGHSWEAHVVENLLAATSQPITASYYRAAGGAEIDLILNSSAGKPWAIEIKRSPSPKTRRGFWSACDDVQPARRFIVYPHQERYPVGEDTEVISLPALIQEIAANPP